MALSTAAEIARRTLGKPAHELDEEEAQVIADIESGQLSARDAADVADETSTWGEKLADRVAAVGGRGGACAGHPPPPVISEREALEMLYPHQFTEVQFRNAEALEQFGEPRVGQEQRQVMLPSALGEEWGYCGGGGDDG